MKKQLFIFAAALALVGCSNSSYDGNQDPFQKVTDEDSAIVFSFAKSNHTMGAPMRRAGEIYGSEAAKLLGGNFIVEGTKGTLGTDALTSTVVFDNYLVVYGANTAGTTESNTNDWEYVGKYTTSQVDMNALWGYVADRQTIKFWDYSADQYDFVAYSTGDKEMVNTAPSDGQIQVTKIDSDDKFYEFTGSAADLKSVYYTDVVTVEKANYNKPVQLVFKNLTSKIRMAIYETVPGYSVQDVEFYTENPVVTPAVYTEKTGLNNGDALTGLYYKSGLDYYLASGTYNSLAGVTYYTLTTPASVNITPIANATLFTADALPTSGTIRVEYPYVGTDHRDNNPRPEAYNKAQVTVTPVPGTLKTQNFNKLASGTMDGAFIRTTSSNPTFAGDLADNYYQSVIPSTTGRTLTLRVNYTLKSTDGSGEEIKVWGAKAIVPATFTQWQPNYAYTYIFKISDRSNGSTAGIDGKENLFPITFDAVVEEPTDATAEQTTITTVATPSITTYQKGHVYTDGDSYLASKGLIYVLVKKEDATLAQDLDTKGQLYTVEKTADAEISEATVLDALLKTTSVAGNITTGRNGIVLTKETSSVGNSYVGVDGNTVTLTETKCVASFTPVAPVSPATTAYYAYVYKVADATLTYEAYQPVAVEVGTTVVDNYKSIAWSTLASAADIAATETADKDYLYFQVTTNGAGTETHYSYITVIPGVTEVVKATGVKKIAKTALTPAAAGTAVASTFYFDVYTVNNAEYGVKVINVQ